jgi:hypothetical protein
LFGWLVGSIGWLDRFAYLFVWLVRMLTLAGWLVGLLFVGLLCLFAWMVCLWLVSWVGFLVWTFGFV